MKQWQILTITMFLVLIPLGMACKERYDINENVIIIDVVEPDGENAQCNITTYNETSNLVNVSLMVQNGRAYSKNLSILPQGTYSSSIICNKSTATFAGECKFKVGDDVKMWDLAAIIGMLGIISLFAFLTFYFHKKAKSANEEGDITGDKDFIKDSGWFKAMELFCILFILFLIILLNNTTRLIASDSGASSDVLSMFDALHIGLIATTVLFVAFMMLRFMVLVLENFKREKLEKEMGGRQQ